MGPSRTCTADPRRRTTFPARPAFARVPLTVERVFLLSPAHCGGRRAVMVLADRARFPLAVRLRADGAPLGEVFSFVSGLYFRGKLAYARHFACPPAGTDGVWVITPTRGLRPAEERISGALLREFATVAIDESNARYRVPLSRDAVALAKVCGPRCDVVLLGSIATRKYIAVLHEAFGGRLRCPSAFVGLGDKSRGGMLLRAVREQRELDYMAIEPRLS